MEDSGINDIKNAVLLWGLVVRKVQSDFCKCKRKQLLKWDLQMEVLNIGDSVEIAKVWK